jgi:hypothetical protein
MSYTDFINENVAPSYATKIGVYDNSENKVGKIELGVLNKITGNKLYSFGLISDVHNRTDQTDENNEDIQRALTYFNNNENVEFTCCCGDVTFNGTEAELQQFKNNIDTYSPNTPFYTTTGNHDAQNGLNETLWQTYTGHGRCFEITKNNDHFIFFGMNKASFREAGIPYLDEDITWLSNKLEQYRNERCFVFTHLFFPTRAGDFKNLYTATIGGKQLTKVKSLCDKYINSVWFSGHSHWKWYLQKYEPYENVYKNNSAWCVHVPSCAYPRDVNSSQTGYEEKKLESEAGVVDVYENFIVIKGRDMKNGYYLPIAQYKLDTTIVDIPATVTNYSITNNLSNATNSNSATTISSGSSYSATISPNANYSISSIIVTMGGTDISSTVVSGNTISISNVTGNIVITVTTASTVKPCTNITLSSNSITFTNKTAQTLTVTVTPNDTTDKIAWSVSPSGICTVNNGVVTPIQDGTCVVTATCGSKSATCNVTVSTTVTEVVPLTWKFGYKPNSNTGVETTATDSIMTVDYIPIDNSVYRYTVTTTKDFEFTSFYCYDADKKYLGRITDLQHVFYLQGILTDYEITNKILSGTKYMLIKIASSTNVSDGNTFTLKRITK